MIEQEKLVSDFNYVTARQVLVSQYSAIEKEIYSCKKTRKICYKLDDEEIVYVVVDIVSEIVLEMLVKKGAFLESDTAEVVEKTKNSLTNREFTKWPSRKDNFVRKMTLLRVKPVDVLHLMPVLSKLEWEVIRKYYEANFPRQAEFNTFPEMSSDKMLDEFAFKLQAFFKGICYAKMREQRAIEGR